MTETRVKLWCAVALLTLAVGGFAYARLPARSPRVAPQPRTAVLVGIRGTDTGVSSDSPGGVRTVCNDQVYDFAAGRWACLAWIVNAGDVPVVRPKPYRGTCTHRLAEQERARWRCIATAPVPPLKVPRPTQQAPGLSA